MRRVAILPFAAIGLAAAFALNLPANADDQTFNFSGFEKVRAAAGVSVVLKQGPYAVAAEGSAKALERLEIKKSGNELSIGRKSSFMNWGNSGQVTVTVSAPSYTALTVSSGASLDGASFNLQDLDISVSSGADFDLKDAKLANISVDVSSGASADITGACKSIKADASSGASFNGDKLLCETASASASSGASTHVYASQSGDGDASSGGSVNIHGNPAQRNKDTSSGGSVSFR